jgi:hypothetical protein
MVNNIKMGNKMNNKTVKNSFYKMSKREIDGGICVEEQILVTKKEGRRLRIPSSSEDLQKCCL